MKPDHSLQEQLDYYRARAAEYDHWWHRQGRYDRGPILNAHWFAEVSMVSAALDTFQPGGRVLELACGTGLWSQRLLDHAAHLTAVDGSPEMLALNAARLPSRDICYVLADLFQWKPAGTFDTVFFSFWLSHVPPERFEDFWALVRTCLAPGGRVFFLDSRYDQTSTALDHHLPGSGATVLRRRLDDGREFQIYKIFYQPDELAARLYTLGWHFEITETDHYFLYGSGHLTVR
jgi:SAM-dependent methyltransferase